MSWATRSSDERSGAQPASCCTHFGGLTFHNGGKWLTARQDVLISLAGSLSQIVLLGIPAYMITRDWTLIYTSYGWYVFFRDLMWVSLVWGIINLLPILPLGWREHRGYAPTAHSTG